MFLDQSEALIQDLAVVGHFLSFAQLPESGPLRCIHAADQHDAPLVYLASAKSNPVMTVSFVSLGSTKHGQPID